MAERTITICGTLTITGVTPSQALILEVGFIPQPTAEQPRLLTIFDWGGLALVCAIGVGWLLTIVRYAGPAGTAPSR